MIVQNKKQSQHKAMLFSTFVPNNYKYSEACKLWIKVIPSIASFIHSFKSYLYSSYDNQEEDIYLKFCSGTSPYF